MLRKFPSQQILLSSLCFRLLDHSLGLWPASLWLSELQLQLQLQLQQDEPQLPSLAGLGAPPSAPHVGLRAG